jgi:hypothetical protein
MQMVELSATRCICISSVNFATITFCVSSQWVFISLPTRSGNFWIHPRTYNLTLSRFRALNNNVKIDQDAILTNVTTVIYELDVSSYARRLKYL